LLDGVSWAAFDALVAEYALVKVDLGTFFAFYLNDFYGAGWAVSFADSAVGASHGFDV
jgi:hypothetical protein